ncbi:response regulator transcription factor [Paenibacillus thermotolerans]|uniref:response regulator transcription factor n=1 Tax=Paenibacillus thermotolerans TaxID=3027807 RepID=UPI002367549F|nr:MULTISPECIES: response regulator [unclassified Paenibacillus]
MLRVMIVDDEPVIRFGIKASVDWEKEGCRVTGDFANGAEALEAMKAEPADILITDIKMPVMDGLALTRAALKLNPRIKVILVSSYNDFEYVREGLKLGVVDYILKPTLEPEDLVQLVRKCAEMLHENERLETRLLGVLAGGMERERRAYENNLKRFLVDRSEELPEHGIPAWLESDYAAVYAALNRVRALEEAYGFLHKSIVLESLVDVFYRRFPQGIAFQTAEVELFFLIPKLSGGELEREMQALQQLMAKEAGTGITFGLAIGAGSGTVKERFQQSQEACRRYFFEHEGIYRYREPSDRSAAGKAECNLPGMLLESPDRTDERLNHIVETWKSCWSAGGKRPAELKEQACRVLSLLFKQSADPYALVEGFDRLYKAETLEELCALLMEQIAELRRQSLERTDSIHAHNPAAKALEYIRRHYLESITLQQVADVVHVSKNYFSILFKKTTGHNFIDYVIELRIQKAKELLSGTDLKIYEVAEQSGFNDVKYFSKLFKKITGYSPMDYRELQHL